MYWDKCKRVVVLTKKDLEAGDYSKDSMEKLKVADIALKEVGNHRFEIIKNRYSFPQGEIVGLDDITLAKILLNEE